MDAASGSAGCGHTHFHVSSSSIVGLGLGRAVRGLGLGALASAVILFGGAGCAPTYAAQESNAQTENVEVVVTSDVNAEDMQVDSLKRLAEKQKGQVAMESTKEEAILEGKRQMIEREAAVLSDTIDKRLLLQRAKAAAAAASGEGAPRNAEAEAETRRKLLRAEAQLAKEKAALDWKLGQEDMITRAKRLSEERAIDDAVASKAATIKQGGVATFGLAAF